MDIGQSERPCDPVHRHRFIPDGDGNATPLIKTNLRLWALLLLILAPFFTGCVAGAGGFIENDALALDNYINRNEDRNLTQTTGLAWDSADTPDIVHTGLRQINKASLRKLVSGQNCEFQLAPVTTIAITAYTPDDLQSFEPVIGDRPYATLLALSGSDLTRCETTRGELDEIWTSSLSVGFLGTTLGEDFQRWAHETGGTSSNRPNGWDNQISDGGEPTFLYSLKRSKLFKQRYSRSQRSWSIGANIGYYTNLHAGLLYRKLLSGPRFTSDFQDVGGTQIVTGSSSNLRQTGQRQPNSVYGPKEQIAFAGLTFYGVIYNAVLQGQFNSTTYDLSESDINHGLFQLTLGLSDNLLGWCHTLTIRHLFGHPWVEDWCQKITRNPTRMTFALHAQSAEYNSQWEETKPHIWAGLHFSRIIGK